MKLKRLLLATAMTLFGLAAMPANAGLLDLEFLITAGAGSSGDFGSGSVDLSGVSFTVSGSTTSDVDIFNSGAADDSLGGFATELSFDFRALGIFSTSTAQTDVIYVQNCAGSDTLIGCVGFVDLAGTVGVLAYMDPVTVSDVDIGQALGSNLTPIYTDFADPFSLSNSLGHSLTLFFSNDAVVEYSVTASTVPEPASMFLLLSGIALLSSARRRKAGRV